MKEEIFPEKYYKAEIAHLKLAEIGVQKKIEHNKSLISFYKKERNSMVEIKELKEMNEGFRWFLKINKVLEDYLSKELKKVYPNAKSTSKEKVRKHK